MPKNGAVLAVCLLLVAVVNVVPGGEATDPEVVGTFKRFGNQSDLTEDRFHENADGFELDAPAFASSMRVDTGYLDARLPGWATDEAFTFDGSEIVLDGQDVRFSEFALDETPRFTMGMCLVRPETSKDRAARGASPAG